MMENIEEIIKEIAEDTLGIYPEKFDGVQRSAFGEGHNAFVFYNLNPKKYPITEEQQKDAEFMEGFNKAKERLDKSYNAIYEWWHTPEIQKHEEFLATHVNESIFVFYYDEIILGINANDLFAYACADLVKFPISELDQLVEVVSQSDDKFDAFFGFAAAKRKMDIIEPRITEEYKKAKKLTEELIAKGVVKYDE